MKIFKYQINQETESPIWVCTSCKKANWEKILLKTWKLIDSDEATKHDCMLCSKQHHHEPDQCPEAAA